MRLFKCQSSSDVCWPLDGSEATDLEKDSDCSPLSAKLVLDLGSPHKPMK